MTVAVEDVSIHHLVELQVLKQPDAIAVTFQGEHLTYRDLNQKANQLAHYLRTLGVTPETLVGICVERSLEMVIALLGILKAGGAYVPLDPSYPKERLGFILEDTQLPIVISQQSLSQLLPQNQAQVLYWEQDWQHISTLPENNLELEIQPSNLAYVIYTSGSTGRPKGVAIEHRNTVAFIEWALQFYSQQQLAGVLASTSLCFDLSVFEIFVTLSCGGKIILAQDALQLPKLAASQEVTLVNTVPSAIAALLRTNGIPKSVQTINLAGEPLQNALVQALYKLEHVQAVYNLYGPSEDTTYSTVMLVEKGSQDIPSIGRPISNTEIYLLDSTLHPVPTGAVGEVFISGHGLARGYLNRPDLTAEKFLPNPFSQVLSERMYRTGDLATYLPDGNLKFLGRIDHQVKIRGFRIELGEIESVLLQHPSVSQALLVARESQKGDKQLVAYIVPEADLEQTIVARKLRSFLQQKLPDYMVPSAFVVIPDLPLTPNGKIDRRALPAPRWTPTEAGAYTAPQSPLELQLANLWSQLLEAEQIGIHDDFFELGGHSLIAIRLMALVNQAFRVEFPLEKFLELPTISQMATTIQQLQKLESDSYLPNLATDSELDQTIHPEMRAVKPIPHFFLTGATGFLGAFLLAELLKQTRADIYCLVRATTLEQGLARLQTILKREQLWDEAYHDRIIPVLGDLSQPYLGLSNRQFSRLAEKIDCIYHCGAWVNIIYPYSTLKSANVIGTQEVLRLASLVKSKPVHFISTVDVFASGTDAQVLKITDTTEIGAEARLENGYAQSKYVAEKLVMAAGKRGLPVTIYRPSNIIGQNTVKGSRETDFVARFIQGCLQMGLAPELTAQLNLVPVDYVSRAIVHLSHHSSMSGQQFNVVNPRSISWAQVVQWLNDQGYTLKQVPYEAWYTELMKLDTQNQENALTALAGVFTNQQFVRKSLGAFDFECSGWFQTFNQTTNVSLAIEDLLNCYCAHFIQTGFFPTPLSCA